MAAPIRADAWGGGARDRRESYATANEAEGRVLPFSCSTNVSNDVLGNLRRAKLGGAAMAFCLYMHRRTFGDAGYHRRHGRTETACAFDLGLWAAEIPNDKSNVRRIRADLVACGIVIFTEDAETPGHGVITWNLAFGEWQHYDKRGGKRQPSVVISTTESDKITTAGSFKITTVARHNGNKITTPDSLDSGPEAARGLVNKGIQKEREILANASSVAGADATPVDAAPSSSKHKAPKAAKPAGELTPRKQYQISLMEAVIEANGGARPTEWLKHWGNAGNLFQREVPLDLAIACYQAERQRPRWDTNYCPVSEILSKYSAYKSSPQNFLEGIKRQRAAANGEFTRAASSTSRPHRREVPTVSHAPTDIWSE